MMGVAKFVAAGMCVFVVLITGLVVCVNHADAPEESMKEIQEWSEELSKQENIQEDYNAWINLVKEHCQDERLSFTEYCEIKREYNKLRGDAEKVNFNLWAENLQTVEPSAEVLSKQRQKVENHLNAHNGEIKRLQAQLNTIDQQISSRVGNLPGVQEEAESRYSPLDSTTPFYQASVIETPADLR